MIKTILGRLVGYIIFSYRRAFREFKEYRIGKLGNDFEVSYLIDHFRGKKIWNREVKRDWLIWSKNIYAENLIIVGGYKGNSARLFLEKVSTVSKIHVYEPVPAYFELLTEAIKSSTIASAFNQGVYSGEPMFLDLSEDVSLLSSTGRQIPKHLHKEKTLTVETVSIKSAIDRITDADPLAEFSLYMNCEGSEYFILEQMLELETIAESIVV